MYFEGALGEHPETLVIFLFTFVIHDLGHRTCEPRNTSYSMT